MDAADFTASHIYIAQSTTTLYIAAVIARTDSSHITMNISD